MEHTQDCVRNHDHGPCLSVVNEAQAAYDNDPAFRQQIDEAMASPTVQRPRRQRREQP